VTGSSESLTYCVFFEEAPNDYNMIAHQIEETHFEVNKVSLNMEVGQTYKFQVRAQND